LGENQETRGTAAKEIVREVCALWFLARKRRGAAVGAEGRKPEEGKALVLWFCFWGEGLWCVFFKAKGEERRFWVFFKVREGRL
jgi:hypothetical protein